MDKYIVKLLPKAYRDIEQIYNYISQNLEEKEIALKVNHVNKSDLNQKQQSSLQG